MVEEQSMTFEEFIRTLLTDTGVIDFASVFIFVSILIGMFLGLTYLEPFRTAILRISRLFLYNDSSSDSTLLKKESIERLHALEKQLKGQQEILKNGVLKNKSGIIEEHVNNYVDENLKEIIENKIQDANSLKDTVLETLSEDVREEVNNFIKNRSLDEIEKASALQEENQYKYQSHHSLKETLDKEARSSSMLKMVMINLFVVSTFMFLFFNIINKETLPDNSYFLMLGVYFSLGAFMLYIIRTSHFRSSVLLAIKEDERNHQNAIEYLHKIKGNNAITEHDVDIVRMIMTNRSEREHKANHPYEVILKGVSGTNIQFKGGKMSLGGKNEK